MPNRSPDSGESVSNSIPGYVVGQDANSPLTDKGWLQARLLGRRFARERPEFDRIYSSTMTRAIQTTEAMLESMGQPIICALTGEATSAGLELALACDVRIAAESATFSLPETAQGQLPMGGGTQRLARLVGRGEALRLILLGEEIDAAEAYRIGLVSAVVPRDELDDKARSLSERMASRGPLALRYAKEAVRRGLEQPLDQALRYETDLTVILQSTEDRAEGVTAFLEKRAPKFEGK